MTAPMLTMPESYPRLVWMRAVSLQRSDYNRRLIVLNSTNLSGVQVQFPVAAVGHVERVDGGAGRADLYMYIRKNNGTYSAPSGFFLDTHEEP